MIRLEDFVSQTIKEIINGVAAAQQHAKTKDAMVNPLGLNFRADQGVVRLYDGETGQIAQEVHFDVAVTASEGTETKGGVGVFVGAFGLGSQGKTGREKSIVSRITFDVPVLLPPQQR
jgi:hypothetical protein